MRALLLVLAFLFAGCNFSSGAAFGADNTCTEQADCPEAVCDEGICVQGSVAPFLARLQVSRHPDDVEGTIPESWTVSLDAISGSTIVDVDLPQTVPVQGRVRWDGNLVPAKLTFTRISETAGLVVPPPVEVLTHAANMGGQADDSVDYAVRLVQDANYELTVEPTSDMIASGPALSVLPPARIESVRVTFRPAGPQSVSVTYPAELSEACTAVQLTRCTLSGGIMVNPGEGEALPQSGLFVRAVENAAGRVVSSIATTNDLGEFAIRIAEGAGEYSLRFNSGTDASLLPVVTVAPGELPILIELSQPTPVTFQGLVRGPDGPPVANATMLFNTLEALGTEMAAGEFSATATTAPNGSFTAQLLPGPYRVLITPNQDDTRPLGVLLEEVTVEMNEAGYEFELPSQINLSGSVSSQEGNPFFGVAVSARSRRAADSAFAGLNRSRDTTTNGVGEFALNLDLGRYDLQVRPPVESGFAWLLEPDVVLQNDEARDWRYEIPVSIAGTVRDGMGAPAAGATVRLFFEIEGSTGLRALRVAEGTTDDEGKYRLLVNPR